MTRQDIIDNYPDETFMFADGLDDAIIGTAKLWNGPRLVVYSVDRCLDVFVKRDKMTPEEAREYFDFNVAGAYMGELTPLWVEDEGDGSNRLLKPSRKKKKKKKKGS